MNFTKEYKDYLSSDRWKAIRMAKLRSTGFKCERCGNRIMLQVHHKNYDFDFGKEKKEDLVVVCNKCHEDFHRKCDNL